MEYITRKFENTNAGLSEKDQCTKDLASQGFVIISEQIEKAYQGPRAMLLGPYLPAGDLLGRQDTRDDPRNVRKGS